MSLLIGWQSPYWFQNRQQKIKENSKHGAIWSNIKRRCFDLRVLTCQRLWDYIKQKLCKSDRVVLRRLIDICSVLRKKFFLQVKAWWVKKVVVTWPSSISMTENKCKWRISTISKNSEIAFKRDQLYNI